MGDVILELAKGLGGGVSAAFPWSDYPSCLKATLGTKWPRMEKHGFWANLNYMPPEWDKAFDTPSGKFEFAATALQRGAQTETNTLPEYLPVVPEGDNAAYPLLMIPYDTMCLSSGYIGSPPFLMKTVPDTVLKGSIGFVEVNPETAKACQLGQGDLAILFTPKAQVTVRVNLYNGIRPGVIAMARGLGHTAYDEYLNNKGVNVNELMGATEDPISGLDAAWGIRAKLVKA
jgi:anaerobic selenocysteine-containing dehydrogenase